MIKQFLPVYLFAACLLCSFTTLAQRASAYDFTPITKTVQAWVDSGYYKGASVMIVKDNKTVYTHYFGNYTPETVAYVASAGKWVAAAVIAAVVDEGKLSWDDKARMWLPELKDAKGDATLRQLLSHTAGYPDYQPEGRPADHYQTLQGSVGRLADLPADTLPGTTFKYGGLAMQVAGRMAELATGKDWETLFQEKIAGPLDMRLTHFTPVDSTPGHSPMLGGGLRTSLQDYIHFLQMIYHNGMYNNKRILSAQAIRAMQADQVRGAHVSPGEYTQHARGIYRNDVYGLGEWREEVNAQGKAMLISSPGWAGAYPWIDKTTGVYGFILTRVYAPKNGFSSFYASPVLPMLVRKVVGAGAR